MRIHKYFKGSMEYLGSVPQAKFVELFKDPSVGEAIIERLRNNEVLETETCIYKSSDFPTNQKIEYTIRYEDIKKTLKSKKLGGYGKMTFKDLLKNQATLVEGNDKEGYLYKYKETEVRHKESMENMIEEHAKVVCELLGISEPVQKAEPEKETISVITAITPKKSDVGNGNKIASGRLCGCGCGLPVKRYFLPGHDAVLFSRLKKEYLNGSEEALKELEKWGWQNRVLERQ